MSEPAVSVLLIGNDESLLRTRSWLLESRGFPTIALDHVDYIDSIPMEVKIALAILCHSLDDDSCARATSAIARRWPQARCLALSSPSGHTCKNDARGRPIWAQEPSALLSAVKDMMSA